MLFIAGISLGSNLQTEWNHPSDYYKAGLHNTKSHHSEMDSQNGYYTPIQTTETKKKKILSMEKWHTEENFTGIHHALTKQ